MKIIVFSILLFAALAQANYQFTDTGKKCLQEIGSNEDTMRPLIVTKTGKIDTGNELIMKFMGCCMRNFISDTNELKMNDDLKTYITQLFTNMLHGRKKLALLVAEDCLNHCKGLKGDNAGATAVKAMDCMVSRLIEFRDENNPMTY